MSKVPLVEEFMTQKVVTLTPDMDIYDAILKMMKMDVSGAPVCTEDGVLMGMLSEKDCMSIFASAVYSNMPGGTVAEYMVMHPETIGLKADLFTVAGILMHRPYRRLPVVEGEKLMGVVSRTDVLKASAELWHHPDGRDWSDSKYLTKELKAMLWKK
ncbi:CBS domain-containing protein [Kiritimatiellaeota bacterium B1221]|nr:CBS domain-containing protein [Kiritimatiellaeota bacterium B1221]